MDIEKKLKNMEEERELLENIICPYCGHKQPDETIYNHVTYWGEPMTKPCDCESCGKKFIVFESGELPPSIESGFLFLRP